MHIRPATCSDIDTLMVLFECARKIMRESGNLTQWNGSYPTREIVLKDIADGHCHLLCDGETIIGNMA